MREPRLSLLVPRILCQVAKILQTPHKFDPEALSKLSALPSTTDSACNSSSEDSPLSWPTLLLTREWMPFECCPEAMVHAYLLDVMPHDNVVKSKVRSRTVRHVGAVRSCSDARGSRR